MTLAPGSRLGPYEIVAPLGAGGMGEVYRAIDTRLKREVAVKVLPPHLASSPESRQRFEREARTISRLSHPHICALYDVGREGDTEYLVMELLEGETLSERLAKGALPLEHTLRYGIEIADALDKAHRAGIVHRDLKPSNVILTASGVKLLDFGLAKAFDRPVGGYTSAPTAGREITREGSILGTLSYMAPEQLEGKEADPRSDIFAFGAVLYEMATGKKAFTGASQASLITAIMSSEPAPLSKLQPTSPPAFDRVVATCLAKEPEERWQSAGDVRKELRWVAEGPRPAEPAEPGPHRSARVPWAIAGLALLAAVGALFLPRRPEAPAAPRMLLSILPPSGVTWTDWFALSPDGRRLALVGSSEGRARIWIRRLDEEEARPVPGTEDAESPFWSPDGRSLGFSAGQKLKKVELESGAVQILCDGRLVRGGSWSPSGVILFAGPNDAILRVPASGGAPVPATRLDAERGDFVHRFPQFLPDGKRFLVYVSTSKPESSGIYVGSLESPELTLLQRSPESGEFVAPDRLLYAQGDALVAERLDPSLGRVLGQAETLAPRVDVAELATFHRLFSASSDVVGFRDSGYQRPLVWFDRRGNVLAQMSALAAPRGFSLSPDETLAAYTTGTQTASDIWLLDLKRDVSTKLTVEGVSTNPLFSRDGRFLYYRTFTGNRFKVRRKPLRGGGSDETLIEGSHWESAWDETPDGKNLLVGTVTGNLGLNLLPLDGSRKLVPLLPTEFSHRSPALSPDGRWLAYDSDESGRREVYVRRFPVTEEKWQVSTRGGIWPYWRSDGKEIYYVGLDAGLLAVPVATTPTFSPGAPEKLFQTRLNIITVPRQYVASRDGQRFLLIHPTQDPAASPVQVLFNWRAPAERR